MSADRDKDESTKGPSREPATTGGAEDETQTMGTQGARITSPVPGGGGGGGSDSARGGGKDKLSGSGKAPLSPPPVVDSSRRVEEGAAADKPAEKMAPTPASQPRYVNSSMSRKKRKNKVKKAAAAAAAVAAAAGGTIEDTNPQETDHGGGGGGGVPDEYPGMREANRVKVLELYQRSKYLNRFPVDAPPEQQVADLCATYVKTIELTMEKRWRSIRFNRWLTLLLSLATQLALLDFFIFHVATDDTHVMNKWTKSRDDWPDFLYPLLIHFASFPVLTVALFFAHRSYLAYTITVNAYFVPLFSILIATGFILYMPVTDKFEAIVEGAIDGVMQTVRHLEDASSEKTREKIADIYFICAVWAVAQSLVCCLCFYMAVRALTALRYYNKYSFESEHPAHTVEHVERSALVGQCTKRVPLTKYQNIADTRGSRTPRTPASPSGPNSPMTAVAETTPLLP